MAREANKRPPRPQGRDAAHTAAVRACDAVGTFIESWGFRSIHGRVWTLLALSEGSLSQAEIAELLGVSRSLVHLAISELAGFGLVRAESDRRNAPYVAIIDVWPVIVEVLRTREWMLIERSRSALEALQTEVRRASGSGYDPSRVDLLLAMCDLAQSTLRAILSVRMPANFDGFGKWLGRTRIVVDQITKRLPPS